MLLGTLKRRGGRAALWLVVGLLIGGTVGAAATYLIKRGKAGIAGGPRLGEAKELDHVPGEAAAFVHIRLRGLYDTEGFAEVRKIINAAGPQAKAALDDSFVPAPSSLDRMTLVFLKVPRPVDAVPPPVFKQPNQPRKNKQPAKGGFPPPPPKGGFQPPPPPPPANPVFVPFGGIEDIGDFAPRFGDDLKVIVLLAFNAPFDAEKVRASHLKAGVSKKVGEREYWEDADAGMAIHFPSDSAMAIGDGAGMRNYLTKLTTPGGPLTKALEHARTGGHHVVAAVNVAQLGIPLGALDNAPEEYKDVAKGAQAVLKAESLMVALAVGEEAKVEVRAKYKDEAAAAASEAALRDLAKFARTKLADPKKQMEAAVNGPPGAEKPRPIRDLPGAVGGLFGLGSINALDEWLADPPLKTDGTEVVLTPRIPSLVAVYAGVAAASAAMLAPAVDKVRVSATRMKDSNNLKQFAIAMHSYHDSRGAFPSQDGKDNPNAKGAGLSWRVHILPYIEHENLYRRFKLDEPWDSPNNKPLADLMPAIYASPFATDPPNTTRYKVFSGREAVVFPGSKVRMNDIHDGTSNTILIVGGGSPVPWSKPGDIEVTRDLVPTTLSLPGQTGCNVAMCDGSVRWIELERLTPGKLKAAVTRAGDDVGLDW